MSEEQTRKSRLIAYMFVFAFALSVATLIYTGLNVGGYYSPQSNAQSDSSESTSNRDISGGGESPARIPGNSAP